MRIKLFSILLFIVSVSFSFGNLYVFSVNEKGLEYKNIVEVKETKTGYYMKSLLTKEDEKDSVEEATLNKEMETVEWKHKTQNGDIDVTAIRQGDKIILTGKFGGKENNRKEITIDNKPWYQIFPMSLKRFIKDPGSLTEIEFWGLRPDDPESASTLVAKFDKEENVEICGHTVDASKIRVSLSGILSIFWSGEYWFRKTDGLYIMSIPSGGVKAQLIIEKNNN